MKHPYRVAMVAACPFPYPRGTPIRIFKMAESLAKSGVEVHVITYDMRENINNKDDTYLFHTHRIPRIKTYKKVSPGPSLQKLFVLDFFLFTSLLKFLIRFNIDVIHAHHYEGLIVSLMARRFVRIPIVYDAHTMLESEMPFYKMGLSKQMKASVGRLFDRSLPKYANHIIAVTDDIKKKLIENNEIAQEKVSVILNGVESDHFSTNVIQRREAREKILIYTGNMAHFQGIDVLLQSFAMLRKKREDVRLCIVTNASFAPYQALAHALGISHHLEVIESTFAELPQYLRMADIAVNPRLVCDGIPQKLLNYMAAGKPIVSFAGSAKVLTHKVTGYIVEGESIRDFAEGILQLLDHPDLMQRIGINAQKLSRTAYGWEQVAEKVLDVYHTVLDHSMSRGI